MATLRQNKKNLISVMRNQIFVLSLLNKIEQLLEDRLLTTGSRMGSGKTGSRTGSGNGKFHDGNPSGNIAHPRTYVKFHTFVLLCSLQDPTMASSVCMLHVPSDLVLRKWWFFGIRNFKFEPKRSCKIGDVSIRNALTYEVFYPYDVYVFPVFF